MNGPETNFTEKELREHVEALENQLSKSTEITAEDLLNQKLDAIPYLVEPLFQKVGLGAVAGPSDVGKSAFLRQLALSVVTGEDDFLGFSIKSDHRSVIYVSSEDDETAMAYLLYAQNKMKHNKPEDCKNLRFVFDTSDLINELDRRLTTQKADLVIIDAFGDLYTGDQNKTNQIRGFLHDYSQLAQKHQCLILFLHHTGKRTEDEPPSKHNLIGGQGFEAKMRLVIELRVDQFDVERRHMCIVKGNYLPAKDKQESHVLLFRALLFTATGERVPFEQLAKPKNDDGRRAKYEEAKRLKAQGLTLDEIAPQIGYSNKGAVSKLLKSLDKVSDVSTGNQQETPF